MSKKILLPFNDLAEERYTKKIAHHWELHETYIRAIVEYECEEVQEDADGNKLKDLPWVPADHYFDYTALKEKLIGVDVQWLQDQKLWKCTIIFSNDGSLRAIFKTKKAAMDVRDTLIAWLTEDEKNIGQTDPGTA